MDLLESLKKAITILEQVDDAESTPELKNAAEANLAARMQALLQELGHYDIMRDVVKLFVVENGKLQEGLNHHFKSNQSKNEFTVKKAMFVAGELTLEIETKKKWGK